MPDAPARAIIALNLHGAARRQAAQGVVHRHLIGENPRMAGFGAGIASGTAVGNQLNVITQGSWNTVIVNSTQINNGNQTTVLNGKIDLQ
jgi:hypothetical protein